MLAQYKQRCIMGILIMGLSVIGTPFIFFVPFTAALGCWKWDEKRRHPFAWGELVPSFLVTAGIGLVTFWVMLRPLLAMLGW